MYTHMLVATPLLSKTSHMLLATPSVALYITYNLFPMGTRSQARKSNKQAQSDAKRFKVKNNPMACPASKGLKRAQTYGKQRLKKQAAVSHTQPIAAALGAQTNPAHSAARITTAPAAQAVSVAACRS